MKWLCKEYSIMSIGGIHSLVIIKRQNVCSKHQSAEELWEALLPSGRAVSSLQLAATSGSAFLSLWPNTGASGCSAPERSPPGWLQLGWARPAVWLRSLPNPTSSPRRLWSLINVLTPNSVWTSAWTSHSEWESAVTTGNKFQPRNCKG